MRVGGQAGADKGGMAMSEGMWRWGAVAVLLWEMAGVVIYLLSVTADPAALAPEQAAMLRATPGWIVAAMAIAVWVGLAGALLLLSGRRLADPLLLISLLAAIVSQSGPLLVPAMRAVRDENWWLPSLIVILLCEGAWAFAGQMKKAGRLR
jgi:hypothetical protein